MRSLVSQDVERCVSKLPRELGKAMVEDDGMTVVAGGYVRRLIAREGPSDIDVYVDGDATADRLLSALGGAKHETEFAKTAWVRRRPVQVITKWWVEAPPVLLEQFDFTVSQAAIWHDGDCWRSICSARFYSDLAAKRIRLSWDEIRVRSRLEAGGTLMRLMKYTASGYSASPETVGQIAHEATLRADDLDDLIDSLRGIDPAFWPEWARERAFG